MKTNTISIIPPKFVKLFQQNRRFFLFVLEKMVFLYLGTKFKMWKIDNDLLENN